ncbi:MAG: DUF58 domain-containing protein [Ilumatobacteraceae bacterium]
MTRRAIALPIPTAWFAVLVAASGLALFAWTGRSWAALLVIESVVVAVFVADAIACTSPRRIDVEREAPQSLAVGATAELAWVIDNRSATASNVTIADALWPSLTAGRRRVTLRMPPRTRSRIRTEIAPTRRGRFPLDAVTVRVTGPLRMVARQATRSVPGSIRVMPAYPSRDAIERRMRMPRIVEGLRTIRSPGAGTEFDQLRDYGPDDEFRRVDWAATLRLQRPIVKQYRTERNQNLVLLLDNGRVMAGTVADAPRVEHGMDAVLAVTQIAARLDDRVALVTFDRQVRTIVVPTNSRSQLGRVAEAMYLLEPELTESAYTAAFSAAAARFRRRSLYVVITDLVEAVVEEALLPALPILTRRHLVVVAAVQDPAVAAWATAGRPEWASDAFRQAAAISALAQRARAGARLRAAGAIVIDAAPGQLGIELVDTYLALKTSGRL